MSGSVKDARNMLKKARNVSENERERSEQNENENSPQTAQVKSYDPRDSANTSQASGNIEDVRKSLKNLHNVLKHIRKRSEPKEEKNSPSRPQEEPYDRAAKQPHQVHPTPSGKVLQTISTTTSRQNTNQSPVNRQGTQGVTRRRGDPLRSNQVAERLSKALDMMVYAPAPTGTSGSLK